VSLAGNMMLDNKYGCLPVVSHHQLVGIVTDSDFTRLAIHLAQNSDIQKVHLNRVA